MTGRQWLGLALVGIGVVLIVVALGNLLGSDGESAASASPSVSAPASSAEPTPSPTPTPEPTPTPLPSLGASDVEAFVPQLVAAIQTGDVDFLVANLHPATLDRYGEAACRTQVATFTNPNFAIEILEILDPAPWDYATEDPPVTTTIPDAWEVQGNLTVSADLPAQPQIFHFAPTDGEVRWFTDCGTPL
jgi:hypothetical protein